MQLVQRNDYLLTFNGIWAINQIKLGNKKELIINWAQLQM